MCELVCVVLLCLRAFFGVFFESYIGCFSLSGFQFPDAIYLTLSIVLNAGSLDESLGSAEHVFPCTNITWGYFSKVMRVLESVWCGGGTHVLAQLLGLRMFCRSSS